MRPGCGRLNPGTCEDTGNDKSARVHRFQRATVRSATRIMAAMGAREPAGLSPALLVRRTDPTTVRPYAELYVWPAPGVLLAEPPASWDADWVGADPDTFGVAAGKPYGS